MLSNFTISHIIPYKYILVFGRLCHVTAPSKNINIAYMQQFVRAACSCRRSSSNIRGTLILEGPPLLSDGSALKLEEVTLILEEVLLIVEEAHSILEQVSHYWRRSFSY
jgi:hypothetical protein